MGNAGADGAGFVTRYKGSISKEKFTIDYLVFQISNASDPTLCEVYFLLHSEEVRWISKIDKFLLNEKTIIKFLVLKTKNAGEKGTLFP